MATRKKQVAAPLDLSALAGLLRLDEAVARETQPPYPVTALLFDADRAFTEYQRHQGAFARLPTFEPTLFLHAAAVRDALAAAEKTWRLSRVAKNAQDRTGLRKEAEGLRGEVMASARFVCRHDEAAKLELDRIDEGEGLEDLVVDLDDVVLFCKARAAVLVEGVTLPKGALARATALASALRASKEAPEAAGQRSERNLLAAIVLGLLKELRAAAAFLFRGEPKRVAAFATSYTPRKKPARSVGAKAPVTAEPK